MFFFCFFYLTTYFFDHFNIAPPPNSLHVSSPLPVPSLLSLTPTFKAYQGSKLDKTLKEHSHCFHNSLTQVLTLLKHLCVSTSTALRSVEGIKVTVFKLFHKYILIRRYFEWEVCKHAFIHLVSVLVHQI